MAVNIFKELIEWAKELEPWEQEAVHRLVVNGEVTAEDEAELFELLKSEDAAKRTPPKIPDPQGDHATTVSLVSLEHVCGVNALAPEQTLTFQGLTVVYGENGSGKSGYSRVLRHACRSRKKPDAIKGDVFCDTTPPAPQAKFIFTEDGAEKTEDWTEDGESSEALGSVAIFDSECARSYVEDDGHPAYRPYGLEVFDELGLLLGRLKTRLLAEVAAIPDSKLAAQFGQPTVSTAVTAVLQDNSAVNAKAVADLATLSAAETKRADELQVKIAELKTKDPQKLANDCRKLATRVENAARAISGASAMAKLYLPIAANALNVRDRWAVTAADASDIAFGKEPVRGVGTEQWKLLFQYAREFSTEVAYPEQPFPFVGAGANCVLCHQPLGDEAKKRMDAFAKFIDDKTAETARTTAADYAKAKTDVIDKAKTVTTIEDSLIEQVEGSSEAAAAELRTAKSEFATLLAVAEGEPTEEEWLALTSPVPPTAELNKLAAELRADAADYEKNSNAEELKKLEAEHDLLRERQQLKKSCAAVTEAAKLAAAKRKLRTLERQLDTRHITLKSGEVTNAVLTKELCAALNTELKELGAQQLEVEAATKGGGGSQPHYLRFRKAPKGDLKKVLSEGEHRVLGIAAFLAELKQDGHTSAIVLDDPVSSLDHRHRDAVARRLVKEVQSRQVIIFTHDLAFLGALWDAAGELQVALSRECVAKTPLGAGVPVLGLFPKSMTIPDLIAHIRQDAAAIAGMDDLDPDRQAMVEHCYGHLRVAWERVVEEVVLFKVVSRFSAEVKTQSLKGVVQLTKQEYGDIFWAMRRISNTIDAHSRAAEAGAPRFISNDEIDKEIALLDAFRVEARNRARARETELKALEEPPTGN